MLQRQQHHKQPDHDSKHAATLEDGDLDNIVAGLDCTTAQAVSRAYSAAGYVMLALGDERWVSYYNGRAQGVLEAGCPK